MSASKAFGLSQIWPRDRFPAARKMMGRAYRSARSGYEAFRYAAWSYNSKLRHGPRRWVSVYGTHRLLVNSDDFRSYRIHALGGTQKEKIQLWEHMLSYTPEIVIDVGANYGEFSVVAASHGVRGFAFEANPRVAACTKESLSSFANYRLFNLAVSDREGTLEFFFNPNASGSGSISENLPAGENRELGVGSVDHAKVSCQRLDHVVKSEFGRLPKSFVMKVDVEGFESSVLAGATELLASADWWRGVVEFSPSAIEQAGLDGTRLWNQLKEFGGVIIDRSVTTQALDQWADGLPSLPGQAPDIECDVIVGRGRAPRS